MRLVITTFIVLIFCISGCKEDPVLGIGTTTDLNIHVVATYDGAPFVMNESYVYEDGTSISFTDFQFYASYLTLTQEGNAGTLLGDIRLIDFEDASQTTETAEGGQLLHFSNIPVGVYNGIRLGIGVVADLNRTTPNDYGDTHPLSDDLNYNGDKQSYIFSKIKGNADLSGNGDDVQELMYEISSDEMYNEVLLPKTISLEEGATSQFTLYIDIRKLLVRDSSDYIVVTGNNSLSDFELMKFISTNFDEAITSE